jgi:hypothetical protein
VKPTRKNLVVVRAGNDSFHPQWIKGESRNFDLFTSYYEEPSQELGQRGEFCESVPGLKWPELAKLIQTKRDLLLSYEACWFPDDDLLADARTISRMFDLFHEYDLWLAQPALGKGSYLTYDNLARLAGSRIRFSGFVEIMCPIFQRETLALLSPTFSFNATGWGLDFLWPYFLNYPRNRIAILDETPVVHTRPAGSGSFYVQCDRIKIDPRKEMSDLLAKYNLRWNADVPVYQIVPAVSSGRKPRKIGSSS